MQIDRIRGDTTPDVVFVKDGSAVVNLVGCSALLTVNTLRNPPDATTQLYQVVGVFDFTAGSISFTPSTVQANQVGFFYYDIQLTEANGDKRTLVKDSYSYTQDITK